MTHQAITSLPDKLNNLRSLISNWKWIFIIIVLSLILAISINRKAIAQIIFPPSVTIVEIQKLIMGNLENQDELITTKMKTKATVKTTEERKVWKIILGKSNLIYEGTVNIQAGLNISELKVNDVNNTAHKISLQLPPPKILNISLDIENSQIIDQYDKWLSPGEKISLQTKAQKEVLRLAKSEACNKEIFESANNQAERLIQGILSNAGYQEIIIKTQNGRC